MIPARWVRRISAGALLVVGVVFGADVAQSATALQGSIGRVSVVDGKLQVLFSATQVDGQLATPVPLAATGATVSIRPGSADPNDLAPRPATLVRAATAPSENTVMLVLDNSGSMDQPVDRNPASITKFEAEQIAAKQFLAGLDARIKVGLVTFGAPAVVAQEPTIEHQKIRDKIDALRPRGKTALFQAVNVAAKQFPSQGSRVMVMVTDGDNDLSGGRDTPQQVVQSKKYEQSAKQMLGNGPDSAGIVFRGLIIGKQQTKDLTVMAPPKSVLVNADSTTVEDQLKVLFKNSRAALDSLVKLTVPLDSAGPKGILRIDVTAQTAGGQLVKDDRIWRLEGNAPTTLALPQGSAARPGFGTPVLIAAIGGLFLAMVVLITSAATAVTAGESKESEVSRRLAFYTLSGRSKPVAVKSDEAETRLSEGKLLRSAVNLVNRIARQRKLDDALDSRLEKAGLPIRTAEWTLLHLGIAVGTALLLLIAARGLILGAVLGLLLGLAGPWMFLSLRTSMRERKFLAQLPDTLQLLAGSLAAGYSLPQAMDAVLREAQAPISVEFNRALIETRLGMPPEDAMEGIAARTASKDFSWVVMAIRIQREVGGNLAELLSTVAETLRERERLRRQVSALSAEGRLSGIILGALPLIFALFLIFTKPDYISPLFQDTRGWILLGGGGLLLLAGGFWMSRLVKVEV